MLASEKGEGGVPHQGWSDSCAISATAFLLPLSSRIEFWIVCLSSNICKLPNLFIYCIKLHLFSGKISLQCTHNGLFCCRRRYLGNVPGDIWDLHNPGFHPDTAEWLINNRKIKYVNPLY